MPGLENTLANVPGLGGFLGQQQFDQEQMGSNIQNVMRLQSVLGAQQQQQEMGRIRQIMASGAPQEKIIEALVGSGPTGAAMAQHYAGALKSSQEAQMRSQLLKGNMDINDPDTLDRMSDVSGFAHFATKAARIRAAQEDAARLQGMQGQSSLIAPNRATAPAEMADTMTDQQKIDEMNSMPPGPKSISFGTPDQALPATVKGPSTGGAFAPLMQSEIPAIAQAATRLQEQVNGGQITAKDAQTRLAQLEARQSAYETARAGKQFTVDNRVVKPEPVPTIPPEHAMLHGADYIATLPVGTANKVHGVIEGKIPLTNFSTRKIGNSDTSERAQIIEMAMQADPTFEAGKAPMRMAVQRAFAVGPEAKNVTAINTAISHLGTMKKLGDALGNHDIRAINALANEMGVQLGEDQKTNFSLAQTAVGDEMMRVFRQVGASEREAEDWRSKFNNAGSPAQINSALKTAGELLRGRIDALNDQWDRGMDTTGGYPKLLSDRSKAAMQSFGASIDGKPAPAAASQYPTATAPNGRKVIFKDGAWQNR